MGTLAHSSLPAACYPPSNYVLPTGVLINTIIYRPQPALRRSSSRNDAQSTSSPQGSQGDSSSIDGPPGPSTPAPRGLVEGDLLPVCRWGEVQPLRHAPDHVAGADGQEEPIRDISRRRMPREAVGDVCEADVTAVAVDDEGEDAVHGHVRGEEDGVDVA